MSELDEITLTVNGIDYEILDEGGRKFTIVQGDEEFAEISLSPCGEYYFYEYYPEFASIDECTGSTHISNHEGILDCFRWVIGICE